MLNAIIQIVTEFIHVTGPIFYKVGYCINHKISTMHLYNALCSYCIAKHFCCFCGRIRVRLGTGLVGRLRYKGWVNSVIINVITVLNYRCNYM